MLDDKENCIRVIVPNLMGHDPESMPTTYQSYFDPASSAAKPDDGRPVHEGLRSDFIWPPSS